MKEHVSFNENVAVGKITAEQKARHWVGQIDNILEKTKLPYGKNTLKEIRKTIVDTGKVTDNQIQAVKNIRWGRDFD